MYSSVIIYKGLTGDVTHILQKSSALEQRQLWTAGWEGVLAGQAKMYLIVSTDMGDQSDCSVFQSAC